MLAAHWPNAAVAGLDSSPQMLETARDADEADLVTWTQGDIAGWCPEEPAGLVFANASLHWLDDHDILFPALVSTLAQGGVLAVQMPRNYDEPSHRILSEVAGRDRWTDRVGHRVGWRPVDEPAVYFDRLVNLCDEVSLWETVYLHVLQGEDAVAQWVKGTAARPFLNDLGEDGEEFFAEYTDALRPHYPQRPDGSILFPFRRLFLITTR